MLRNRNSVFVGCRGALLAFAAVILLTLFTPSAQAQSTNGPANDDFINAEVVGGDTGVVTGDNTDGSLEPGELNMLSSAPVGASIWYSWTATSSGTYTFDTSASLINTVLGVFTGTSVDSLTLVGANDDFSGGIQSSVTFEANAGTTYYFGIYGWDYSVFGLEVDTGKVFLHWAPGGPRQTVAKAGDFSFTSTSFSVGEDDATFGAAADFMDAEAAHATITRSGGSSGRVWVSYQIGNGLYTNRVITEVFGTNITFGDGSVISFANYNKITILQTLGHFGYTYLAPYTNTFFTNVIAGATNWGEYSIQNLPTVLSTSNFVYTVTNGSSADTYSVFYDTLAGTEVVPAAIARDPLRPGGVWDYVAESNVVVFDDFQMSAKIYPFFMARRMSFGFNETPMVNPEMVITLTGVELDPLESPEIAPPTLSQNQASMIAFNARVLQREGYSGTNVFNFERSTIQCREGVRGNGFARVHVYRIPDYQNRSATSVPYRIDYLYPYDRDNNLFGTVNFDFMLQAGSEYATPDNPTRKYGPNADFTTVTGTLDFGANEDDKFIDIPIIDDARVEFNEDMYIELYFPDPPPTDKWLGNVSSCILTILFDEQPAGALDRDHNRESDPDTSPPYNAYPGANSTVYSVAVQSDGSALFAGDFTSYNTVPRNRIARMQVDGQIDLGFNPGDGADQFISAMQLDTQGRIVIGGAFSSFNRTPRNGIARLLATGSLDTGFKPGLGANNTVWAVAHASNGSIYIAGEFTMVNGTNRNHIARLRPDGSLDASFDPGLGPDGAVYALTVLSDDRVIIGGQFSQYGGVARSCLASVNGDGTLDTTFNPRSAAVGPLPGVYALALQGSKILIGGIFDTMYGVARNNLARMNLDGSIDLTFDPGTGANSGVYSITLQTDNRILIGGNFTSYNETRRVGLARLYADGMLDTTFLDTAYNQFAGVPTQYYNPMVEPKNYIYSMAVQADGNIIIGGSFERVGGSKFDRGIIQPRRDDIRNRRNVARLLGGETPGPGNIELSSSQYSGEIPLASSPANRVFVQMTRLNGNLGPAAVSISPDPLDAGPGAAVADRDYSFDSGTYGNPTWEVTYPEPTWQLSDGIWGQNNGFSLTVDPTGGFDSRLNDVYLNILSGSTNRGNLQLGLNLSAPRGSLILGGEEIPLGVALGRDSAQMTMIDGTRKPGVITFATTNYIGNEGTNAYITVIRTNGTDNRITVQYATGNLGATNGIHYTGITNTLVFNAGVTSQTFTVATKNRPQVEKNQTVLLRLFNPSAGVTLGVTNAVLTLVDRDVTGGYVEFTSVTYSTNEASPAAYIGVTRLGSSAGLLSVQFSTIDNNAIAGVNYSAVSTNLSWPHGDVVTKYVPIPLTRDGLFQETNFLTVGLRLSSARINGNLSPVNMGIKSNSVLTIVNADFRGQLAFGVPIYSANENGGPTIVTVDRTGGSAEAISVHFGATAGTAFPDIDFMPTNGTLFFAPGELSKSFAVGMINNLVEDLPGRFITLSLSSPSTTNLIGTATSIIEIVDDETLNQPPGGLDNTTDRALDADGNVLAVALQPDGKFLIGGEFGRVNDTVRNRLARLESDGSLDTKFGGFAATSGANDKVQTITVQTDGRILIGGSFNVVNGVQRNFLARLNYDGSTDSTFNPGAGPESSVLATGEVLLNGERKLLVGGSFLTYNGAPHNYLLRLNDDGSIDTTFSNILAPNGPVHTILVLSDGSAVIGGDFTMVNGVARNRLARITAGGALDTNFDVGSGADASVRALALQADGRILVGGSFTMLNDIVAPRVGRLLVNGAVDTSFNVGVGANDLVATIAVQNDTRILIGGQFTSFGGVTRQRLTRLNNDGSVDPTINFGAGANSFISAIVIQPDSRILLGGGFTTWDSQPARHITRVFGGSITGSGVLEFTETQYVVGESVTNALVSVRRRGGTSGIGDSPNVTVLLTTTNGTGFAGTNYLSVTTNIVFPPGEVLRTVMIPVIRDYAITPDLTVGLILSNPSPDVLGGPQLGNIPTSTLLILNDDSAVSFSSAAYRRNESALEGAVTIPIYRTGSSRGEATVQFLTSTNGTAVAGTNYLPVTEIVRFVDGQTNAFVYVPLLYDPSARGDVTVAMELTNSFNALLFSPSSALLTIVDVDRMPGDFVFAQTNYVVSEDVGFAQVTIIRTNGRSGTATLSFNTAGGTAIPNAKYGVTNGVLAFSDGEIIKSIGIPIFQNSTVEGHQFFNVTLASPSAGSTIIEPNSVPVTILDDDVGIGFSSPIYIASEKDGVVTLTVNRVGTNGVTTVDYVTTNSTAMVGTNYMAGSGTLSFTNGEAIKTFSVTLLRDPRVTGDLSFLVSLRNPSAPAQLFNPSTATVAVLDADPGVAFTNSVFGVTKSGTNVLISVYRTNANTGDISVRYNTFDESAKAGVDYVATSGLLTFSNGIALQSFVVPIIKNQLVQSDVTFGLRLFDPQGGAQVVEPGFASVYITNDLSGVSYSSRVYNVNENGVSALISVLRTGYTSNTVSVDFTTADGSARAGAHYQRVAGTLVFTNGESLKTFSVPIIDNNALDGDKTLLLDLSNPVGNLLLSEPSAAVVNILENDGSLVTPAGAALIGETGTPNGVIDTNETVTILFGLRNASGTNTVNLMATLLATNGVLNPSGPQNYGVLPVHGPATSRPFTFSVAGTNGQAVTAVFLLVDGAATNYVSFDPFSLGRLVSTYSNATAIVINDRTNATPYPSVINVANLAGVVTKATVTITNFYHTAPSDVSMLLVSPAGQKTFLVSKAGGNTLARNVTLTFDDDATLSVPKTQIVSGTYKPTCYAFATPPFPVPVPPAPYSTNLGVFIGSNPNGNWALYVFDDSQLDTGAIYNGWSLNLTIGGPVPPAADLGLALTASTNIVVASSNLTYTLTVTNYGPSSATNVVVTDTFPRGGRYVTSSATKGSIVTNGTDGLVWTVGNLAKDTGATLTFTLQATLAGAVTNFAQVTSSVRDPNSDDDYVQAIATVMTPAADLVLGLSGTPNPLMLGGNVLYSIAVTNLGPATATDVSITAILPPEAIFVSASPAGYTVVNKTVTFTNLGMMFSGGRTSVSVVAKPIIAGTLNGTATCNSTVLDPLKGNNTASVKTIVEPVVMDVRKVGNSLVISWTASAGSFVLESSPNLALGVWTRVSNPQPTEAGGMRTITLPIGQNQEFFRLRAQ
jgi:uncharacterized repeat protein (TIGR01451 family)/uncharacterized delta-60 repeat protein